MPAIGECAGTVVGNLQQVITDTCRQSDSHANYWCGTPVGYCKVEQQARGRDILHIFPGA